MRALRFPIIAALAACCLVGAAPASGYQTIDPRVVATSELFASAPSVHTTATGEAAVMTGSYGNQIPAGQPNLAARVRDAEGTLGPLQYLTGRANPSVSDRPMTSNTSGGLFAAWGGSPFGEWIERPAGGPFTTSFTFGLDSASGPACGASIHAAYAPNGTLLVACTTRGNGTFPNDNDVVIGTRSADGLWFAAQTVLMNSDDNFIAPRAAVGRDGTLAAAWSYNDAGTWRVRARVAPGGGSFGPTKEIDSAADPARIRLRDVVVLGDGTVAVLYTMGAGGGGNDLWLSIRGPSPDASAAFTKVAVPLHSGGNARSPEIVADGIAGAALLAWGACPLDENDPCPLVVATRPPGGPVGSPETLETSATTRAFGLTVGSDGTAALGRMHEQGPETDPQIDFSAWVRPPGGTWGGPHLIATAPPASYLFAGFPEVNSAGELVAAWTTAPSSPQSALDTVLLGGLDKGTPPSLGAINGPGSVLVGEASAYAVRAGDSSGLRSVTWTFGDGSTPQEGREVAHTFTAPGSYDITVTATDGAGNQASATRKVTIFAVPVAPDRAAPTVTVKLAGSIRLRTLLTKGLRFSATSSEPARFEAELRGRAGTARISAARPYNLILGQARVSSATTATLRLRASRKLIGRSRPSRLQVRLTVTDGAGNAKVVTRTVRIKR